MTSYFEMLDEIDRKRPDLYDLQRRVKALEDELARFWAVYQGDKHLKGSDDKGSAESRE